MRASDKLLRTAIDSPEEFGKVLKEVVAELGLTLKEFGRRAGISLNTLYKITSSTGKDLRLETVRTIVRAIDEIERERLGLGEFIAIVTNRETLDLLRTREIEVEGRKLEIREYPANTLEEVLMEAIRAERDGARGIICGPIAARNIEKVVSIPVVALRFTEDSLLEAIRILVSKITG